MDGCESAFKKKPHNETGEDERGGKEGVEEVPAAKEISAASGFLKEKKRGTDGFKTAEKIHKVARVVPFGYLFFFSVSSNQTTTQPSKPINL